MKTNKYYLFRPLNFGPKRPVILFGLKQITKLTYFHIIIIKNSLLLRRECQIEVECCFSKQLND
jgi:hypothetical protein